MITEKEILERLASGDSSIFKHIYKYYYDDLCKYVYIRFTKNKEDAEEIIQNIFFKLWENHNKLSEIKSLRSYLFKAAYNASLNYIEHLSVIRNYQNETLYHLKKVEFNVADDLPDEEKMKDVNNAINEFPEQTKKIFILKYIDGLKYKDIAQKLNISNKTVETLLYRGLKKLRLKFHK